MDELHKKYMTLRANIREMERAAVAFSGGVDSTFLMKVAKDVLGDNAFAVTISSETFPERELLEAKEFCEKEEIKQYVRHFRALEIDGFRENPKNRCYICKKRIFEALLEEAKLHGARYLLEGSNLDDQGDYRPGMRAVKESGALSPLRAAGLSKQEIRILSKELQLPTWTKPSFACLATRFVYGQEITLQKLQMVDQAEQFLMQSGFKQVRVRINGNDARIEVPREEIARMLEAEMRELVAKTFHSLGFSYVSVDLDGYRTGSMNESLTEEEKANP